MTAIASDAGRRLRVSCADEIDLRGFALAPGFIDIHSHTDLVLFANPKAESKIRQGVTTEVVGQDGGSIGPWNDDVASRISESYQRRYNVTFNFRDLGGFFSALDSRSARRKGSSPSIGKRSRATSWTC